MKSPLYSSVALLVLVLSLAGETSPKAQLTVFALVKAGDSFVAPAAKDKITGIHSEKSAASLVPDVWYVDYYDSTTAFKTTEVKFVDGKMMEVKQPKRLLNTLSGTKLLEWRKLKIDSDHAMSIALKDPLLKKVDLQAAQFWLERTTVGATWKIRFWMARMGKPNETTEIGDLYISSKSGEILKNDLHF